VESEASAPEHGAGGARARQVHLAAVRHGHGLAGARCARGPGREPGGWPRWRRQLLERTWDPGIVVAEDGSGILPLIAYARLLGVQRKAGPPGLGTCQASLATYGRAAPG
jgi:hypothetical protein